MQLIKANSLHDLAEMERDLDKLWDMGWSAMPSLLEGTALDMYEEGGNLVAKVSLPNFKKDEVNVTTDEGVLEISAKHKEEEEKTSKRRYYFRGSSNQFFRRVTLPKGVKADKTNASFKNGVLKVTMPIAAHKKTKTIAIK